MQYIDSRFAPINPPATAPPIDKANTTRVTKTRGCDIKIAGFFVSGLDTKPTGFSGLGSPSLVGFSGPPGFGAGVAFSGCMMAKVRINVPDGPPALDGSP